MASEDKDDRTEQPTEKRLRDAREKGDVPRSRELGNVAVLGTATVALMVTASSLADAGQGWLRGALMLDPALLGHPDRLLAHSARLAGGLVLPVLPMLAAALLACLISPAVLGGLRFSTQALQPDFKRLNPASGLARIYGKEGFAELLRSLMRVGLVLGVGAAMVYRGFHELVAMPGMSLEEAIRTGLDTALWALLAMVGSLAVLAAVDVPWQHYRHRSKLKMTKQEIRDEFKEMEGNPEVKAKVRQIAQQMSQRRMVEAVPTADVVVTNPTHYAVALKYDAGNMRAPKVVAKGVDEMALAIRDVAGKHRVAVLEAPPLARALYRQAQVDQEIPVKLYAAVAQVLSYIYQLRRWHPAHGPAPVLSQVDVGADGAPDSGDGEPTR
ncbi:flagellar biosynthesis protein FlhB [Lysobacter arseniciresistens ZS79]|uniref:Flagellar biosynthetic protein FlhB n=1 Tax=Lysobacter arseniciresistens ZS79 TaxID=913325 RepID=A0A0A0F4E4_9GAMM|nr:flagellar biosynthesis protein FlhB [Lysobacter arseniciresistens]KGM57345.1 flagellar biosynthesis protein FlhB [Lysobacter arseniciresistens ZS79]